MEANDRSHQESPKLLAISILEGRAAGETREPIRKPPRSPPEQLAGSSYDCESIETFFLAQFGYLVECSAALAVVLGAAAPARAHVSANVDLRTYCRLAWLGLGWQSWGTATKATGQMCDKTRGGC
jgi:hypothetical protein